MSRQTLTTEQELTALVEAKQDARNRLAEALLQIDGYDKRIAVLLDRFRAERDAP